MAVYEPGGQIDITALTEALTYVEIVSLGKTVSLSSSDATIEIVSQDGRVVNYLSLTWDYPPGYWLSCGDMKEYFPCTPKRTGGFVADKMDQYIKEILRRCGYTLAAGREPTEVPDV